MMKKMLRAAMPRGFRTHGPGLVLMAVLACPTLAAGGQDETGGVICGLSGYLGRYVYSPGETVSIGLEGDIAYVLHYDDASDSSLLLAIGLSDPSTPEVLGVLEAGEYGDLTVENGLAYLFGTDTLLSIYDVSDPAAMHKIGSLTTPADGARSAFLAGGRAYLLDYNGVFRVVDVSEPGNPALLGTRTIDNGYDLAIGDGLAYIVDIENRLLVLDLSEPATLPVVQDTTFDLLRRFTQVAADDGLLVISNRHETLIHSVADGGKTLTVLNDMANRYVYGNFAVNSLTEMALCNDVLTTIMHNGGVHRVSLDNPAQPEHVGQVDTLGYAYNTAISDGLIVVAGFDTGLSVVDPSQLNTVSSFEGVWFTFPSTQIVQSFDADVDMARDGDRLYIPFYADDFFVKEDTGVAILDVSDPTTPQYLGAYLSDLGRPVQIAVRDGIAYILRKDLGLEIVDLSDPNDPRQLLVFDLLSDQRDFAIDDATLCLRTGGDLLLLLDMSDPGDPGLIGIVGQRGDGFTAAGRTIYISHEADDDQGTPLITTIDMSNASFPVYVSHEAPGVFGRLHIEDGVLYAYSLRSRAYYAAPLGELGAMRGVDLPGELDCLDVEGGYVYIGFRHATLSGNDLLLIDAHDPAAPREVGSISLHDWLGFNHLSVKNGYALTHGGGPGVSITNVSSECGICAADFNADGVLDFLDVSLFLSALSSQDPVADLTDDGLHNFFDISVFLTMFSGGCQ